MNYLKSNLAFLAIIVLVVIVLLLSGFIAFNHWQKKRLINKGNSTQKELNVVKKDLAFNKNPEQFPTNIPIEEGAEITQNYNATTADGRLQATRAFITNKSLADNLKIYQDYFKTNDWKVIATVDQDVYKMILGSKDNTQIQVSVNENSISKVKTVDISMTKSLIVKTIDNK